MTRVEPEHVETRAEANGHEFVLTYVDGGWQVSACLLCGGEDPRQPCRRAGATER